MEIKFPAVTKSGYDVVNATLLYNLAPHLANVATFALHRCIPSETTAWYKKQWFVGNVETGAHVAFDLTKAGAIRKAIEILSEQSESSTLAAMERVAAEQNPSSSKGD